MNEEIAEGSFGLVPTNRPTKTNYLKRSYRLLTKCLVCTGKLLCLLTCSRHRNLQNIRIRILQIFVLIFLMILQQTI